MNTVPTSLRRTPPAAAMADPLAEARERARQSLAQKQADRMGPEWTHRLDELRGIPLLLVSVYGPKVIDGKFGPQPTLTLQLLYPENGSLYTVPASGTVLLAELDDVDLRAYVDLGGKPAVCFAKIKGGSYGYWTLALDLDGDLDRVNVFTAAVESGDYDVDTRQTV